MERSSDAVSPRCFALLTLLKGGERWAKGSVNTLCFAASGGETILPYFDFNEYQATGDVQRGSARPLLLSRKGEPYANSDFCQACMPWLVPSVGNRKLRQTNGFGEESMASQADGNKRTQLSLQIKGGTRLPNRPNDICGLQWAGQMEPDHSLHPASLTDVHPTHVFVLSVATH